ncbi:MAG: hypothetical protein V3U82_01000 [Robiginitomaculum sp.]
MIDFNDNDLIIPTPRPGNAGDGTNANNEAFCLAFLGAAGGVGVSSLVIESAFSTLKRLRRKGDKTPRVCIIDLDFEHGAIASYLDMEAGISPDVLTGDGARIDQSMTSALVVKHASGLRLLAARNALSGNDIVNPACVLALMDAASAMYDVVILDVPRIWRPWTHAALAAADRAVMVTQLTIPALHGARIRMEELEERLALARPMDVVLSKHERRSFRATVSVRDAQAALGRDITAFICVDGETPRDAMNCGEPSGNVHPSSRYVKDITALTEQLLRCDESEDKIIPRKQAAS